MRSYSLPVTPTGQPVSMRLPGEHFAAAILYLVAGAGGLVWIAPELAAGNYLSPHVAGVTHLFTLGWLTMTIFGALYQLLPVALGARIRWPKLGHVSFWTFCPGVGLFACGVAGSSTMLHHAGIGLVATGVTTAIVNIAATLPLARRRDATWAALALALIFLSSTFVLGVVLLHNIQTGFIAAARVHVLATHLHVAIVGWALVTIIGVGDKLFPMFLLSRGVDSRWTKRSLVLVSLGIPVLAVGLNAQVSAASWSGLLLIEGGVACFVYQSSRFYRDGKRLDVGMRFAAAGMTFLVAAALLGPILLWQGPSATRLATAYVFVGLIGGIIVLVTGFFYNIAPMLAWVSRYRGRTDEPGTPTMAQMISPRVATVQLGIMPAAVVAMTSGILAGWLTVVLAGAILFLVSVLLLASQIARAALGGRVDVKAQAAAAA